MDKIEKLAREHGTGGWQTLEDMVRFGKAVEVEGLKAHAVNALMLLNDEARAEVFDLFCAYCGKADPGCQCWNDE